MSRPIKQSKLYRAASRVPGRDKRKLARALRKAVQHNPHNCILWCTSLSSAMCWAGTPQGHDFWEHTMKGFAR